MKAQLKLRQLEKSDSITMEDLFYIGYNDTAIPLKFGLRSLLSILDKNSNDIREQVNTIGINLGFGWHLIHGQKQRQKSIMNGDDIEGLCLATLRVGEENLDDFEKLNRLKQIAELCFNNSKKLLEETFQNRTETDRFVDDIVNILASSDV